MPNIALRLPDDPTAAQIAAQVRIELAIELARLDVAVSTRATPVAAGAHAEIA